MLSSSKYFQHFSFEWDPDDVLVAEVDEPERQAVARRIHAALQERTLALTTHVQRDLFAERLVLDRTPTKSNGFTIHLTRNPRPGTRMESDHSIWTDVEFDPHDFLDWPQDPDVIGERLISLAQDAVSRLEAVDGFPADLVRNSFKSFRDNNHVTHYGTRKGVIDGTPLKVRMDVFIDALTTRRDLCVLYRGTPLLSTTVNLHPQVDWSLAVAMNSVELAGTTLTYRPISEDKLAWWRKTIGAKAEHPLYLPVEIDLSAFPSALEKMREKGWIAQ